MLTIKINTVPLHPVNKHKTFYKVVMYIQKLHHFCDTSLPDDGLELGRKYLGNN